MFVNYRSAFTGVSVSSVGERLTRITFQTSYLGKSCDSFIADLRLGGNVPLTIVRHDIPQFVPLSQIVAKCSSLEFCLDDFVWNVYSYLNAYVTRKQDVLAARVRLSGLTCGHCGGYCIMFYAMMYR